MTTRDSSIAGHTMHGALYLSLVIGLYWTSSINYLLFHSLAEIFSIVVAFTLFMIAWNSRIYIKNQYILFLGLAYLFIGFLDLLHTLSYKGMAIFTDYDYYANQLWIATRFMESLSLLAGFLFLSGKWRLNPNLFLGLYLVVTTLIVSSVFVWKNFPVCFAEGSGLTPFKKYSEYVICLILLWVLVLLYRKRSFFDGPSSGTWFCTLSTRLFQNWHSPFMSVITDFQIWWDIISSFFPFSVSTKPLSRQASSNRTGLSFMNLTWPTRNWAGK